MHTQLQLPIAFLPPTETPQPLSIVEAPIPLAWPLPDTAFPGEDQQTTLQKQFTRLPTCLTFIFYPNKDTISFAKLCKSPLRTHATMLLWTFRSLFCVLCGLPVYSLRFRLKIL
uniref:Uncharacterized protein n=1 Tax=Schistocephalus solidus TaxID=70667 RepID=A0A0X3P4Q1_SCHSO